MAPKGEPRQYFNGYPDRARRDLERDRWLFWPTWLGCGVFLWSWMIIAIYDIVYVWRNLGEEITILGILLMIFLIPVGGFLTLLGLFWTLGPIFQIPPLRRKLVPTGRVVPIFEQWVGVDWDGAPSKGRTLARHAAHIDAIMIAAGVPPLSDLGLDDDLAGKQPQWRDPAEGVAILDVLAESLRREENDWDDDMKTMKEIAALREALSLAQEKGVRYALAINNSEDPRVHITGLRGVSLY